MDYLTRIDVTKMDFGWDPNQRVAKVTAALAEQRAHLRTAPVGSIDADTATRNVADLEETLARAEVNEAAGQKQAQALEAAETAKRQENDDQALAAITDRLRRDFLTQPGTTLGEFEQALPELLAEDRRQSVLNAPAVREQQLAEQRRRLGSF